MLLGMQPLPKRTQPSYVLLDGQFIAMLVVRSLAITWWTICFKLRLKFVDCWRSSWKTPASLQGACTMSYALSTKRRKWMTVSERSYSCASTNMCWCEYWRWQEIFIKWVNFDPMNFWTVAAQSLTETNAMPAWKGLSPDVLMAWAIMSQGYSTREQDNAAIILILIDIQKRFAKPSTSRWRHQHLCDMHMRLSDRKISHLNLLVSVSPACPYTKQVDMMHKSPKLNRSRQRRNITWSDMRKAFHARAESEHAT